MGSQSSKLASQRLKRSLPKQVKNTKLKVDKSQTASLAKGREVIPTPGTDTHEKSLDYASLAIKLGQIRVQEVPSTLDQNVSYFVNLLHLHFRNPSR